MNLDKGLLQRDSTKRIAVFLVIGIIFYTMRSLLSLFLFTFLFTYLINSIQNYLLKTLRRFVPVKEFIVTIGLYSILFASSILLVYAYVPIVIKQCIEIINYVANFIISMGQKPSNDNQIIGYIMHLLKSMDIAGYIKNGGKFLFDLATNLGKWSFNIFVALLLSMFFMFEKDKIKQFMDKFSDSKIQWISKEIQYFGRKFSNSFGKVIQTQILIAIVNSILSVIALWIMGFPKLLGLGAMIFLLSLIPVAGVVISLIPLSILAFSIGGVIKVVYVLTMIAALHSLESYVLNPKIMSEKVKLPVFFTFLVLIISEHLIGIWGLIVGLPIVMFLLDVLEVTSYD